MNKVFHFQTVAIPGELELVISFMDSLLPTTLHVDVKVENTVPVDMYFSIQFAHSID